MASVTVAGTAQVELRYLLDDEPAENTLYFNHAGAWTAEQLIDLGAALIGWWVANIQPLMSVHASLRELYLTDLTSLTGAAITSTVGLPLPGDISGENMPNNVAACISFRTANRGRSYRGRNYLMGLHVDQVNSNNIIPTLAIAYKAAYDQLYNVATDQACTWVVVSRYSGYTIVNGKKKPTPRAAGISTPVQNVLFVDTTVDSQRGRLPNH